MKIGPDGWYPSEPKRQGFQGAPPRSILFDSARAVKSSRRPFGVRIFTRRLVRSPVGPSEADRAWAAYELNKDCRDYDIIATAEDRRMERLAEESAEMDLVCRGFVFA